MDYNTFSSTYLWHIFYVLALNIYGGGLPIIDDETLPEQLRHITDDDASFELDTISRLLRYEYFLPEMSPLTKHIVTFHVAHEKPIDIYCGLPLHLLPLASYMSDVDSDQDRIAQRRQPHEYVHLARNKVLAEMRRDQQIRAHLNRPVNRGGFQNPPQQVGNPLPPRRRCFRTRG